MPPSQAWRITVLSGTTLIPISGHVRTAFHYFIDDARLATEGTSTCHFGHISTITDFRTIFESQDGTSRWRSAISGKCLWVGHSFHLKKLSAPWRCPSRRRRAPHLDPRVASQTFVQSEANLHLYRLMSKAKHSRPCSISRPSHSNVAAHIPFPTLHNTPIPPTNHFSPLIFPATIPPKAGAVGFPRPAPSTTESVHLEPHRHYPRLTMQICQNSCRCYGLIDTQRTDSYSSLLKDKEMRIPVLVCPDAIYPRSTNDLLPTALADWTTKPWARHFSHRHPLTPHDEG